MHRVAIMVMTSMIGAFKRLKFSHIGEDSSEMMTFCRSMWLRRVNQQLRISRTCIGLLYSIELFRFGLPIATA